jgi:hypothetical protein
MKTRLARCFLAFAALLFTGAISAAEKPAGDTAAPKPDDRPVVAIIVSDSLTHHSSAIDNFVRLDIAFQQVAKERDWPVKLVAERFAAGVPDYDREIRIFSRPIRNEVPGELVYRAWLTVQVKGHKEQDFGMVVYRFYPRLGQNPSDTIDDLYLGFAKVAADKVEPILFPKADPPAPPPKS